VTVKCFLFQDWVDVSGTATVSSVIQSEPFWLDLAGFRDVIAWLEVRELTNAPSLLYQTAPTKDEPLFSTVTTLSAIGTGVTTTPILQDTASVPLARWFRWQASLAGSAWDISFRIWIAANAPGRANLNRTAATRR
jgi:hypothetical protein